MLADPFAPLTPTDRERLMRYKHTYILVADGFSKAQARRLCFLRWLAQREQWGPAPAQRVVR